MALNLADAAAIIDTTTGNVRYVSTGHYPYGAGITTDGNSGWSPARHRAPSR